MSETVAYQGVAGAFGEEACRLFLPAYRRLPRPSFAAVVAAVAGGDAKLGMLPVENDLAGPVPGVDALIRDSRLSVRARHRLPISLHFMAKPGTRLADVRVAASHVMALRQCAATLARLGIVGEEAANTAMAAEALAASDARDRAVIASAAAASLYGLAILARDVQDRADVATTFCVVARSADGAP